MPASLLCSLVVKTPVIISGASLITFLTISGLKLLSTLPSELKADYEKYVLPDEDSEEYKIMKCADKISAYIKCIEEVKSGNNEFIKAKDTIYKDIKKCDREEVKYFVKHILPRYELTLDELE